MFGDSKKWAAYHFRGRVTNLFLIYQNFFDPQNACGHNFVSHAGQPVGLAFIALWVFRQMTSI